jgi:small nuclear ribonucleoprotein B and B'
MPGKMLDYINRQLHVTLMDGRLMSGQFLAYDKHMNVVLQDVVESRPLSNKGIPPRKLGLVLVRGEHVASVRVEKSKAEEEGKATEAAHGPGVAVPGPAAPLPVIPGKSKKANIS